mgnify:CR=1 FL=1
MKKIIFIILLVIGIGGWIIFNRLDLSRPIELETYEPSPECAPAYTALCQTEAPDSPDNTHAYDIERTVRILNSLEAAQSQSETFEEFLEYMARQDYRGVSPDVLAAKRKFFPILEEMNQLRHTSKELSSVWYCLKNASRKLIDEAQGSGSSSNYMLSLCSSGGAAAAATCIDRAFSSFCEQQDLKRKTENRLNRLRRQYIAYIEQYAPIYYKYMDEWNTLCLDKDRAYINLYAGKLSDALNASQKVLDRHPENREGLLLKALSLIRLGAQSRPEFVLPEDAACNQRWIVEGRANYEQRTLANPCYFTARRILDQYMELYSDKAAPALLLDGILEEQLGHDARAIALYEQAAIEYPRQAEALTDLLDAYTSRTYLAQSVEGNYLLNYYRSTMTGAGIFSPNFRKAALFARQGNMAASQEEIYKHFFRRGSQAVQDCLLSDMQYCENYLYGSFKPMLLEQSYIDLKYSPATKFMGMGKKKNQIAVSLENRSDIRLENIRIFLCIHATNMYKDDYRVVRVGESKNAIDAYGVATFDEIDISPHDINDITRMRAIVMTDDKICWVDSPQAKRQTAIAGILAHGVAGMAADELLSHKRELFMKGMKTGTRKLCDLIHTRTSISQTTEGWFGGSSLYIRLPRILALLSPCYTINPIEETDRVISPTHDRLAGNHIEVYFKEIPNQEKFTFYIYSEIISFNVLFVRSSDGSYAIERVTAL